jgi:cytidylate kinase
MGVITISRQSGSLDSQIAQMVAERSGYRLVWRELINQAARQAGAPEVALAMLDELGILGLSPSSEACQAYRDAIRQVILDLAEAGNVVIVGRAGQVVLHGRPDVLHVRLIAPEAIRIERIAEQQHISYPAAQAQIKASDRSRRLYLKNCFEVDWNDTYLYHLSINTGLIGIDEAASLICEAARFHTRPEWTGTTH